MNKLIWLGLVTALGMSAVETRAWRQTDYADFEKGALRRLSLRSDGRLTLAPAVREVFDPSVGYLWAVAEDSKGNLYTGGGSTSGSTARLYKIDAAGKSSMVAELDGLEIHAIAIDAKDAVYAATAPDGKIYRVRPDGKAEVYFDPKAKYIWSMVFGANGDLFIGTGDKGEVWRVPANGKGGAVFFKTDETHARSLALDAQGNLIVGTEPSGLILRVTPAGQGFVLHQTAKREVTAVAVARNGTIYATAVGNRSVGVVAPLAAAATPPPVVVPTPGAVTVRVAGPAQPSGLPPTTPVATVPGGTEVYRIDADGYAKRIWNHATELAYSIALDSQERPVIATGNRGGIYRIEPMQRYTLLTTLAPTQVTQLLAARSGGAMYAATGNIGKIYKIGPGLEKDGVFESDLFDVGGFTYWGRSTVEGRGGARIETRSGNLNSAHQNWSPWTATSPEGRIQSPAARYLQYKLTLTDGQDEVDTVDLKYQAKNVAPTVEEVEVTPPNYKFPAPAAVGPSAATSTPASLTLPAIGRKRSRVAGGGGSEGGSSSTLTYAKGFASVRWSASDENGDALVYKVEIRGVKEVDWKLLRDKLRERYYSWDSAAFADGEYVVRVSASDAPSNTPEQSLSAILESEPFLIDNTPPEIRTLSGTVAGGKLNVAFEARDVLSNIVRAEYSLNGSDWIVAEPSTRLSDAKDLRYRFSIDRPAAGEYTLAVRVTDEFDNQTVAKTSGR